MKLTVAFVFLQCLVGIWASEVPSTKTYGSYSMTHAATSTGVYAAGTTNTYNQGSTIYYPQGATVTYPTTCTVYYPTPTTIGGTTYNAGAYTYQAGSTVLYAPGTTCYFPRQTACRYGTYNGQSSCAVRYPTQTPVQCSSPSQPVYYGPGQYNSGQTYTNYNQTGGTRYVNNPDGSTSSVCNTGYTNQGYPMNYVTNMNTGATSYVTQTATNYVTYNSNTGSITQGYSPYG